MPKQMNTPVDDSAIQPATIISPQKARQGRMGKHTLVILIVSLVLAVAAGFAVGFIPLGRP